MPIKILATADLHLGKSSADVSGLHASTKYTWQKIIDYCIHNQIDVLVLCGDIVDWDNRYFEAIGPLQKGFEDLYKHGILTVIRM
jgi:DNA repair exonuclease SbcCD nuclease subunit